MAHLTQKKNKNVVALRLIQKPQLSDTIISIQKENPQCSNTEQIQKYFYVKVIKFVEKNKEGSCRMEGWICPAELSPPLGGAVSKHG